MATTRIYELYPTLGGGYTTRSIAYDGELVHVAAVSAKQALYFAGRQQPATSVEQPAGIVETYRRGAGEPGDHWLWCGCRIFGGLFQHAQTKTTISAIMREHLEQCPSRQPAGR